MIRNANGFFTFGSSRAAYRATSRLSPEEDALIIGGEDDDIDETMPADLWFRIKRPQPKSGRCRIIVAPL